MYKYFFNGIALRYAILNKTFPDIQFKFLIKIINNKSGYNKLIVTNKLTF